ncbi:D-alanyl-lipoteichoic acid biosynthesis protein DltB [Lactobacillus sp. AN1001]
MSTFTPYQDPTYFVILSIALIPIVIAFLYGKRLRIYEFIILVFFLYLTFGGKNIQQGVALIGYLVFETLLVSLYNCYRKKFNNAMIFYLAVLLTVLPLIIVKITPFFNINSYIGFLGISYLTFKSTQTVMEIRDGVLKNFNPWFFLQFLAFFPTISSGPIDRYRRFEKDYYNIPSKEEYLSLLDKGVQYLFLGFIYNFILSYFFGTLLLPQIKSDVISTTGISISLIEYMYVYSMYLFFNFAGYSLFAVGTSYILGIKTPMNFNKPFISKNIKEFWNRWHITLSFWFRDYVYMRMVFLLMRKKVFKSRRTVANVTYILNMLLMGIWHGETWYYILYGLIHGIALIINDWWLYTKKKKLQWLPHNKITEVLAIFITFNFVCFTFLIFSGILDYINF